MIPILVRRAGRAPAVPALLASLLLGVTLAACSANSEAPKDAKREDPLKNTKALAVRGYHSLYENGAIDIPFTTLKLIPKGPTKEDFLFEQAWPSAKRSFRLSIEDAKQATAIVADGTRYSFQLGERIHKGTEEVVEAIRAHSRPNAKLIADKSYLANHGIRGESWEAAERTSADVAESGQALRRQSQAAGQSAADTGARWIQATPDLLDAIAVSSFSASDRAAASLSATGRAMAQAMVRSGDDLILTGAARFQSAPDDALASYRSAAGTGSGAQRSLESAGQGLSHASVGAGDALIDRGQAALSRTGPAAQETYEGVARHAGPAGDGIAATGRSVRQGAVNSGAAIAEGGAVRGIRTLQDSQKLAGEAFDRDLSAGGARFGEAGQAFVVGYMAVPGKAAQRYGRVVSTKDEEALKFRERRQKAGEYRAEESAHFAGMLYETYDSYGQNVQFKLDKASRSFNETVDTQGFSFAAISYLRWMVEGIVWDGVVKPAGKATGAMFGWVAVNGIAYPTMVAVDGTRMAASIVAEATVDTAGTAYDIVAPTGTAAVAASLGVANSAVGLGKAIVIGGGGTVLGVGDAVGSQVVGRTVQGVGAGTGAVIEYLAVPAVQAGIHLAGATSGVVAGSATMLKGTALVAAGAAVEASGAGAGKVIEYGIAPATNAVVRTGGAIRGAAEGVYDATTGAVLYATGQASSASASTVEASIKYGVAPATQAVGYAGGVVGAGAGGAGQLAAGTTVWVWGQAVKTTGWVAGRTIEHVGAPVAMAGIVAAGTAAGGAVQGSGYAASGLTYAGGELAAGTVWVFGNTIADATVLGGTTVSAGYGSAVGLYEVAESMVVPVGRLGGAGIALSYKTLTYVAAQTLLGVSDAAYCVLSLEGPRWVVYAVTGKLDSGDDIAPGTVLDLKKMQESGEEFRVVPLSDEETRAVVGSMQDSLPETKDEASSTPQDGQPKSQTP